MKHFQVTYDLGTSKLATQSALQTAISGFEVRLVLSGVSNHGTMLVHSCIVVVPNDKIIMTIIIINVLYDIILIILIYYNTLF